MLKFLIRLILLGLILHHATTPIALSESDKPVVVMAQLVKVDHEAMAKKELEAQVKSYLESKHSPLAEKTSYILEKKQWRLIIAISAIESQWCNRKLYLNCWGIGGDSAYRHYPTLETGIDDTDALINRWQAKGKWLTPASMNCSYVVPCNKAWVKTVNSVIHDLNDLVSRTVGSATLDDSGVPSRD